MSGQLQLQRDMAKLKVPVQFVLGLLPYSAGVGALVFLHHLGRQCDFRGIHGPDMQVMHFADARQLQQ